MTRLTLCNLAVSPRFLQGFHKKIAWPTDTRFSMVAEPFRKSVKLVVCEFAILDNGVTGLETHFYRNHSWLFFKVFGLGGNGFWTIPRSATSSHRPESAGELPLRAFCRTLARRIGAQRLNESEDENTGGQPAEQITAGEIVNLFRGCASVFRRDPTASEPGRQAWGFEIELLFDRFLQNGLPVGSTLYPSS